MFRLYRALFSAACFSCFLIVSAGAQRAPASNTDEAEAPIGVRPYEMDWAARTAPAHPALIGFEDLEGWATENFGGAQAQLYRSKQELLFDEFTAKAVYSGTSPASYFRILPPQPIPIPEAFTGVNLWVRGNNWGWVEPPATARVGIAVLVQDAQGEEYKISLGAEDFDYWSLMHCTIVSPDGRARHYEPLGTPNNGVIDFPAVFTGIEISGCSNTAPARLYFDALQFYAMEYPPLSFEPAPATLPWPTTPDTILSDPPAFLDLKTEQGEGTFAWIVRDQKNRYCYRYTPQDGTLGDISVEAAGQLFYPCRQGGITFTEAGKTYKPGEKGVTARCLGQEVSGDKLTANWELVSDTAVFTWRYTFQVKGTSLIVDIASEGRAAAQFDIGLAGEVRIPKPVYFPYLSYENDWPKIICATGGDFPLFLSAFLDYYTSDASELFGAPRLSTINGAQYAGGALYLPTTAGVRNPLCERLFITVSGDVQKVLPNIPNPDCDTGQIAREYLWRNIGHVFQNEMLAKYKAYGIDKFIACHHEVGWREGGESFTLRDRPAPSIGEEKLAEYGGFVRDLGYRFGTYTNYVDFAPVNANWNEEDVCLDSEGRWQRAWPRTYALKPLRAVEKEAYYAPRIHERYGTSAQYCDVHTAYSPWGRTDYDARTPGAGMFRTQYNAFARLLQNESIAHHGPVFSEGNYHWFYAGIVDGNYATMLPYGEGWKQDPLVDFDLLKMHPKMTDFGMGTPYMYYRGGVDWNADRSRLNPWFDRFITATIAFGHIGFLPDDWDFAATLKAYYLLQALQQRYTLERATVIRYFNGAELVDTSKAIATDAQRHRQVFVRYASGLDVWCNLNAAESWDIDVDGRAYRLPPAGFLARKPDDLLVYSACVDEKRHELVQSPEYLYLDTRDALVQTDCITGNGAVAVKREGDGAFWVIPATACGEVSISRSWMGAGAADCYTAGAYNLAGECIADATLRHGDKAITLIPMQDAEVIKYRLQKAAPAPVTWQVSRPDRKILANDSWALPLRVTFAAGNDKRPEVCFFQTFTADGTPLPGRPVSLYYASADKGVAEGILDVTLPDVSAANTRCWSRCWLPSGDPDAADTFWLDLLPVPPLELALTLASDTASSESSGLLEARIYSNLSKAVDATARLRIEKLISGSTEQTVRLTPDAPAVTVWPFPAVLDPQVAEVNLEVHTERRQAALTRYLEIEPAENLIADLIQCECIKGQCLRDEAESPYNHVATGGLVDATRDAVGGEFMRSLFMHPPYKTGVGYEYAAFRITLPEGRCRFYFSLGFRDGSTSQDGCVFKVLAIEAERETVVFEEQYSALGAWAPRSVDLTPFAGRGITLKLITDVGPDDNSNSDWALWGSPRVVAENRVRIQLTDERPPERFAPPPDPLRGLTLEDLRNITAASIRLESAGVDIGKYASFVFLNGQKIGETPVSESDAEWASGTLEIPAGSLQLLRAVNTLIIKNPGHDCMKIRRVCLHFQLADGRAGTSWIALGPFSSAKEWKYAEGESVTNGEDLPAIPLSIPVE